MIDCDDQPIDNAYEEELRRVVEEEYAAWSWHHHTAWAQGRYAMYKYTMQCMAFLPDDVRIEVWDGGPSAASLAEIPEVDFSKAERGKYAKRLKAKE